MRKQVIVTLGDSGKQFTVRAGETVLSAALRAGLLLPYSCRTGSCGTCKATLVSGQVDYGSYQTRALDDAERNQGRILLCRARPLGDLVIEAKEIVSTTGIEIKILPCRVASMTTLAHDVMEVRLALPRNQSFRYLPGQYIDILLQGGRRRSFSIANLPREENTLDLHIRRVRGGEFSTLVFERLQERDLLRFQGPFGTFFLRDNTSRPIIFVAGGTGFAPVKAIVEQALASGVSRPMHLFWGVRARRDLYLGALADAWARSNRHLDFTPVLSAPRDEDDWQGATGLVPQTVMETFPDLADYDVYAAGPPAMIEWARSFFPERGLPADRFFCDSFEFASDPAPVANP